MKLSIIRILGWVDEDESSHFFVYGMNTGRTVGKKNVRLSSIEFESQHLLLVHDFHAILLFLATKKCATVAIVFFL